jgi:hypothetical protein
LLFVADDSQQNSDNFGALSPIINTSIATDVELQSKSKSPDKISEIVDNFTIYSNVNDIVNEENYLSIKIMEKSQFVEESLANNFGQNINTSRIEAEDCK